MLDASLTLRWRNQLLAPAVQRHPAEAIAAGGEVFSREPLKRSRESGWGLTACYLNKEV
jgi:hypothetical protein